MAHGSVNLKCMQTDKWTGIYFILPNPINGFQTIKVRISLARSSRGNLTRTLPGGGTTHNYIDSSRIVGHVGLYNCQVNKVKKKATNGFTNECYRVRLLCYPTIFVTSEQKSRHPVCNLRLDKFQFYYYCFSVI